MGIVTVIVLVLVVVIVIVIVVVIVTVIVVVIVIVLVVVILIDIVIVVIRSSSRAAEGHRPGSEARDLLGQALLAADLAHDCLLKPEPALSVFNPRKSVWVTANFQTKNI